jgi:hypothetical protein
MATNVRKIQEELDKQSEKKKVINLYRENRTWSDKFIPEIKKIVGPQLLDEASFEVDATEATDLIVFKAKDIRIAARVRKAGLRGDFLHQFTLRSKVRSGTKTELEKISEGWGDLMFYAHANADETSFDRWFLIDLAAWRAQIIADSFREPRLLRHDEQSNSDGTAFRWFDVRSFAASPPIVRAASHP